MFTDSQLGFLEELLLLTFRKMPSFLLSLSFVNEDHSVVYYPSFDSDLFSPKL